MYQEKDSRKRTDFIFHIVVKDKFQLERWLDNIGKGLTVKTCENEQKIGQLYMTTTTTKNNKH